MHNTAVKFLTCILFCADNEECSPLLAEYFRTKKMLDDTVEEEKQLQLIFEITSDDGFCIRARSCDGKVTCYSVLLCLLAPLKLCLKKKKKKNFIMHSCS